MTIHTRKIAITVAYLSGVRMDLLNTYYGDEYNHRLDELRNCKEATIIRYLCKLRTSLFQNFKSIDSEMKYNLKRLDSLSEWVDVDNIKILEEWGLAIVQPNFSVQMYIDHLSELITVHSPVCRQLFEDWVNFEYIRELFIIPKCKKNSAVKKELAKYNASKELYPFQMYIFWNPVNAGNIFHNDEKLLSFLYRTHNKNFIDTSKVRDASVDTKESIYNFIENSSKTAIVVDCENSDVFKLYGVLRNLDPEVLSHIERIVLYDDIHTTTAWDWLGKFTNIPVEYCNVERINDYKSLVDIKMTAGVCALHYKDDIDSFILFSSDSDFWGLISSLPSARFLVMYEDEKCGYPIRSTLQLHNILNSSIDDFCTGNATDLKKAVLLDKLKELSSDVVGMEADELLDRIYKETRITRTKDEATTFYNKYIRTLQLRIDDSGKFYIHICS